MKKLFFASLFTAALAGLALSAQTPTLPTVAVATFDIVGGITRDEAQVVTELFMSELVSKGTVNVVDRVNFDKIIAEHKFQTGDWSNPQKTAQLGKALNADHVIRGQLMKMGNTIYLTATMIDINTAQVLHSAKEQVNDLGQLWEKLPGFCSQILIPNYFIGKWTARSTTGNCVCRLEFKPDGTIIIEQYDEFVSMPNIYSDEFAYGYHDGTGEYSFDNSKITIYLRLRDIESGRITERSSNTEYTFNASKNNFSLEDGFLVWMKGVDRGYYTSFTKTR
jgi:TolB-like protein